MKRHLLNLVLAATLGCFQLRGQTASPDTNASVTTSGSPVVASDISLAPYLQVLSADSVAVSWQTAQPAYGWVEYGETKNPGTRQDTVVNGLRLANVMEHHVTLAGLRPGATYWYRVGFKPIHSLELYKVDFGPEQRSEIASFQTLPAPQQKVTAVIFNDLHNNLETYGRLCQTVSNTPFDFSIFNGDCLADPASQGPVLKSLAAYTQGARAGSRPALFVRGNHEDRGAFARELPRYTIWPAGKPYFSFDAGPVHFIVLDCGEDKPDEQREYSGLVDFTSYRREETEWLKTEVASPGFRNAAWRVAVHHIPLYKSNPRGNGSDYSQVCQNLWGEMLAKGGVDLALNAHTHIRAFHPINTIGNPYPMAVGGAPQMERATVMILEADNQQLKLRMLDTDGHEVFPVFEKKK